MTTLSANVRLRPARIALLVRPSDTSSVRKFMRINAALWGGIYNPIIPVFRTPPKEWKDPHFRRTRGYSIARGYIEFFEPDLFVEAEAGLIEVCGLGAVRDKHGIYPTTILLDELLRPTDNRDWSEPQLGLCIVDALRSIYDKEQRFQLRERRPACVVKPDRASPIVEAMFGVYPTEKPSKYISKAFADVYQPEQIESNLDAWRKVFMRGAETPLRVTRHGIESHRSWHHDLVIYIFDPAKTVDLIDLWNLRLEPRPVLPVPLPWLPSLRDEVAKFVRSEYRQIRGNPQGLMHHATIEFGRSVAEQATKDALELLPSDLPRDALSVKRWRNAIWVRHTDDFVHRDGRLAITANEKSVNLTLDSERLTAPIETLSPEFAAPHAGHSHRWVNAVRVSNYSGTDVATVIPFNTFDRSWPRMKFSGGERILVGTEGWVFGERYKGWTETVQFYRNEEIVIGALKGLDVEAKLSEPGHIAKQVLEHLGGMWGIQLLADRETLGLLNAMAGGLRVRSTDSAESEEIFDRRSKPLKEWQDHVARRKNEGLRPRFDLEDFTRRNILRLGIETGCPHCQAANWHSLDATDYTLKCERCLKDYPFPQASLRDRNRNWVYRVIGPFSVPDYARGSYGALLALNVLSNFGSSRDAKAFATALNLNFDGVAAEADYVALHARDGVFTHAPPELVVGEAKSFGVGDLIKAKDIAKLRAIAKKLPGAVIAISVLRDDFTESEKDLLRLFVKWCRRLNADGEPTNRVLLLTGTEIFFEFSVHTTWERLGGKYAKFSNFHNTRNLTEFAEATVQLHLELPPFYEERRIARQKRNARKGVADAG